MTDRKMRLTLSIFSRKQFPKGSDDNFWTLERIFETDTLADAALQLDELRAKYSTLDFSLFVRIQ